MARLLTLGAETADHAAEIPGLGTGSATSTTRARTGSRSFSNAIVSFTHTGTLGRAYFTRQYILKTANPGSAAHFFRLNGIISLNLQINVDGTLSIKGNGGAEIYTTAETLNNEQWYRIESKWILNSGSSDDTFELYIDGLLRYTSSTLSISTSTHDSIAICVSSASTVYVDDVAFNDDQGSSQNSYPGPGKVVLLIPISDAQVGSWTGGSGGTSNLSLAVDNIPPAGTATESNTTQIESVDASGDNSTDEYRANLQTYSTGGLTAQDVIAVIHPLINDGEDVATGTKTGSFGLQSNPSQSYSTFTFGDNIGALGTWPTGWRTHLGNPIYNPAVTLGSSPVLAVRKTDTGTRVASVDFMGVYVEYYTPSVFEGQKYHDPKIYPSVPVQQRSRW
jgi:hypothetical protein